MLLSQAPTSLAIPLRFNGQQPNHFGAEQASAAPMRSGSFVGDTRQGGSCNAEDVMLNPHCNGTHTESLSHVINELIAPHQVIKNPLMTAQVVSVEPEPSQAGDSYEPALSSSDLVINLNSFTGVIKCLHKHIKALIIRTLPNSEDKLSHQYGNPIEPPFFTHEVMRWLAQETNVEHLLVDVPSVDRLYDDGLLSNHRIFWNIKPGSRELDQDQWTHKTITEMIYVPDEIKDGHYLLNLQIPRWHLNAVPSNPVLYPVE